MFRGTFNSGETIFYLTGSLMCFLLQNYGFCHLPGGARKAPLMSQSFYCIISFISTAPVCDYCLLVPFVGSLQTLLRPGSPFIAFYSWLWELGVSSTGMGLREDPNLWGDLADSYTSCGGTIFSPSHRFRSQLPSQPHIRSRLHTYPMLPPVNSLTIIGTRHSFAS